VHGGDATLISSPDELASVATHVTYRRGVDLTRTWPFRSCFLVNGRSSPFRTGRLLEPRRGRLRLQDVQARYETPSYASPSHNCPGNKSDAESPTKREVT